MKSHSRYWREGYLEATQGIPAPKYGWKEWRKQISLALGYAAGLEAKRQGNIFTTIITNF